MSVRMTDAPALYQSVVVDIQSVEAHRASEAESNGWVTLSEQPMQVDLLTLTNGADTLLGEADLEAGHYDQIRLVLGDGNQLEMNGQTYALVTPSGQQSGYKLNIDANVQADVDYTLLIDFDASQSVVATGSSSYMLKPVLHAVSLEGTGSLSGMVEPDSTRPVVYAISSSSDTTTTYADTTGGFAFKALAEGNYSVTFKPTDDAYKDTTISNVEINAGEETDLGTVTMHEESTTTF